MRAGDGAAKSKRDPEFLDLPSFGAFVASALVKEKFRLQTKQLLSRFRKWTEPTMGLNARGKHFYSNRSDERHANSPGRPGAPTGQRREGLQEVANAKRIVLELHSNATPMATRRGTRTCPMGAGQEQLRPLRNP